MERAATSGGLAFLNNWLRCGQGQMILFLGCQEVLLIPMSVGRMAQTLSASSPAGGQERASAAVAFSGPAMILKSDVISIR